MARHAIAAREEPKDVCAGSRLQSFLLSEQARTSAVVTKLTSLYCSLSLLHRSYADIVSLARFSLRASGLHNSFGSLLFSKLKKRESPRLVEGHVWCPSTNSPKPASIFQTHQIFNFKLLYFPQFNLTFEKNSLHLPKIIQKFCTKPQNIGNDISKGIWRCLKRQRGSGKKVMLSDVKTAFR